MYVSRKCKFLVLAFIIIILVIWQHLKVTTVIGQPLIEAEKIKVIVNQRFNINSLTSISNIHASVINSTRLNESRYEVYSGADLDLVTPSSQHRTGYVILSCSVISASSSQPDVNYAFYLPLTVMAWRRMHYDSVVLLVGDSHQWLHHPLLTFLVRCLLELGSIVILVPCKPRLAVMLGQVSRLFASAVLPARHFSEQFLVTADADLWPLDPNAFTLDRSDGSKAVVYQQPLHNFTSQRGQILPMVPLSGIGMTSRTWHDVMGFSQQQPLASVRLMLDYLVREFGDSVMTGVIVRGGRNWFTDQRLISVRIARWANDVTNVAKVRIVPRAVTADRVDRAWWPKNHTLTFDFLRGKIDAHLFFRGYRGNNWVRLLALLKLMYGTASAEMRWCEDYHTAFIHLHNEHVFNA